MSSLDPRLAALSGRTIADRYRVGEVLGVGGMGVVFRAQQLRLKREVAIKVLNPDSSEREEGKRRFAREAESAARLDHKNCVQVYDFGTTEDGIHYMVMPILEGQALGEQYRLSSASPQRCAELAFQLFAGLDHAHARGVIHRDLKPDNLFLVRDGKGDELLKIVDFGIAKLIEGGDGPATQKGLLYGTPAYMSPEQAAGDPIDTRSDLFSAGLILYRLLTGELPGRAKTALDQMRKRATQEIPLLPTQFPDSMRELIAKLCTLRAEERIGTAAEARDSCEKMLSSWRQHGTDWTRSVVLDDDPTEEDLPYATPTNGTSVTAMLLNAPKSWIPVAAGATAVACFALAWTGLASSGPELNRESAPVVESLANKPSQMAPSGAVEKPDPPPVDLPAAVPEIERSSLQLLTQVNQPSAKLALPRAERHALFAQLEGDPNTRNLLDHRANLAMDLYQASQAENPCDTYLATLRMIEASRDPYFLPSLEAAGVPTSDGEVCENEAALLEARVRVRAALQSYPKIQEPGTTKRPAWRPSSPAPSDQPVPDDPLSAQGSVTDKLDG